MSTTPQAQETMERAANLAEKAEKLALNGVNALRHLGVSASYAAEAESHGGREQEVTNAREDAKHAREHLTAALAELNKIDRVLYA